MSNTHFGFQTVDENQKAGRVRGVFDSVASKYDVMNDLMSMGLHRAWKAYTVSVANLREGQAPPARSSTPTSTRRCCARAETACWTKAPCCRR
jgi:ubiE/COQ5 methyltransferase family